MVNIITAIGIRVKLDHVFFLTGQNLKKSHNVQSVTVPGWLILLEREQSRGNTSFKLFHIIDVCFMDSMIFKNKKSYFVSIFFYFDLHITKSLSKTTLRIRFVMSISIQLFNKVLGLKTGFA